MSSARRIVLWAILAAAALAGLVPILGIAAPANAVLPDLVADAPTRPIISNYTYPDGTQALLLRFDGYVHNIGPGPFEIRGSDRVGAEMTTVRQYVSSGGSMVATDPPAGSARPQVIYETADGHNHFHLMRIARYSLWNSARTAEVAPAQKVGFCLVDSERIETNGPATEVYRNSDFCRQNNPTAANLTMGVSAGWRDQYHRDLALQWVDISDVRPGNYWLAAEIDTDNVIVEANEANNTRTFAGSSSTVPGYVAQPVNAGTVPSGQATAITLSSQTFGSPGTRRFRIETAPGHGTLRSGTTVLSPGSTISGSQITYTPASGYSGPDSFTYSAYDSTSQFPRTAATAAVSLSVDAPSGTTVDISGAPSSLNVGTSAQLTATVTGGTGGGVTWAVNGVAGGNSTVGTISSSGLYQAPATVPSGGSVTIRATSASDPAAFDEVQITIVDPGDPDPAPGPGTNLIANPSFETDDENWTSWNGAITREQVAGAPNGVWVAKVTRTGGSGYTLDDSPTTVRSAVGGAIYSARAFVKAASASSVGKTIRIYLRERTSSGGAVRTLAGPSFTLTNAFQAITHEIAPRAAGNQVEIYIAQVGAGTGDAFYVDQIELTTGSISEPPPPAPNQPPTASFTNSPTSPQTGQTVTFTDTSTDTDGTIAGREWDLDGDGAYDDSTAAAPTFVYSAAGDVTVRLRVTDDDGATATTSRVITVTQPPPPAPNQPPTASFTNSPTSPQTGQTVTFTDTSTDTDGTIAGREWDLDGDGAYDDSTAAAPTFVYSAAGDVTVRLRVTDDDGATATTSRVITVTQGPLPDPPPPSSNLIANPSFETDDENWTSWNGAITREQVSGAPDGSWVAKVTRNSGTGFTIDDSPTTVLNAQGGVPYRARAMVKAASGSSVGKTIRIYLRERTGSGGAVRTVAGPSVTLTNSFQAVTHELTPAAGNQLEIYVAQVGAGTGDAFHIDAIQLTVGP